MDLLDRLRRIPIFEHLSPSNMVRLREICEVRNIPEKARLTQQAEMGVTLFIIDRGEAIAHRVDEEGNRRPVAVLEAGDYFGATSLFLGEPRDATVTATTPMRVWMIRRGPFMALMDDVASMRREVNIPPEIAKRLHAPRFDWLDRNEWVVLFSRRHWLWYLRKAAAPSLVMLVYALALALVVRFTDYHPSVELFYGIPLIVYSVVMAWLLFDWRDDYFVVTNRRITHRERQAFIYESRNEAPLDRVQNINTKSGPWGAMFGYATITIETAADVGSMMFPGVPKPDAFQEVVWEQINRAKAMRRAAQRHKIRDSLADQTGMRPVEAPAETDGSDLDTPVDHTPEEPTRMERWLARIAETDLLPRTRIETEDSITWRKHWLFLAAEIAFPLLVTGATALLAVLGFMGEPAELLARVPWWPWLMTGLSIPAVGWLWWTFDDWGNDLYIVTDERIIDIEKRPFFLSSTRREASLGMIQNVQLNVPGIIAATFGYGNVVVQTAGSGEFTFDRVSRPHQVQSDIFRHMHAFRRRQEEREATRRRAELAEWFGVYEEMRQEHGDVPADDENAPQEGVPQEGAPAAPEPDEIEVRPVNPPPPIPEIPPPPPDPDVPTPGGDGNGGGRTEF